MKTIANCVEEILISQPFLEEALMQNIINYSALSKQLQPLIEKKLHKSIKSGAIMMALRRYKAPININSSSKVKDMLQSLGDITVRSDLTDFTYKNSTNLINNHSKVLEIIKNDSQIFYTFTRGIHESNILISSSEKHHILTYFKHEKRIALKDNLSAISINLPKNNSKTTGLYYQIFKRIAWEGISLYEVISTTNEFTIVVEDYLVDKAFSIIKQLKDK